MPYSMNTPIQCNGQVQRSRGCNVIHLGCCSFHSTRLESLSFKMPPTPNSMLEEHLKLDSGLDMFGASRRSLYAGASSTASAKAVLRLRIVSDHPIDSLGFSTNSGSKPSTATFNIQPSTSNLQHPTFNIQPSTSNLQHPTFNIQHPTSNVLHCRWFLSKSCPISGYEDEAAKPLQNESACGL
jgi:hypothetical protein